MAEKSMIEVKLWDEYLVFAAVMGIADEVYRQAKLAVPQFDDYYYGYDPYMACLVASNFGEAGARGVASATSSSDGSSSFGGGGSSFSGGGGGGDNHKPQRAKYSSLPESRLLFVLYAVKPKHRGLPVFLARAENHGWE